MKNYMFIRDVSFCGCKDHVVVLVVILLCGLIGRYQPFKGRCCFRLEDRAEQSCCGIWVYYNREK